MHDSRKSAPQLRIVNSREILPEYCLSTGFIRTQNSLTHLRTVSPEEMERRPVALRAAEPVDFIGDCEHAEPVGIVQRQGEVQVCQMPGAESLGLPLDWILLIHCESLIGGRLK
jgi:hypothetical protein